jgi:hypothetical protein
VVAIAFVKEVASLVLEDSRRLLVILRREDPAGLEEGLHTSRGGPVLYLLSRIEGGITHPANKLVGPLKPRSELFVRSGVVPELCDGVEGSV